MKKRKKSYSSHKAVFFKVQLYQQYQHLTKLVETSFSLETVEAGMVAVLVDMVADMAVV